MNTVSPTEILDDNGSVNISAGNSFKLNGVAITDTTYNTGTNITIDASKNLNLNSPLTGISDIQNTSDINIKTTTDNDIVSTRNTVQIAKICTNGVEMLSSKNSTVM